MCQPGDADRIAAWLRQPRAHPGDREPDRAVGECYAATRQFPPGAPALVPTPAATGLRALLRRCVQLRTAAPARRVAHSRSAAVRFRLRPTRSALAKRPPAPASRP